MNTVRIAFIAACALLGTAHAADIAKGKEKANAQCAACHAKDGNYSTPVDPSYPKLAGQHQDYLVQALTQYKNGGRKNGIMAGMAANLSKEDIQNVAAYFASLPSDLSTKK